MELNEKLSRLEAQQAEHCKSVSLQHQQEKDAMLQSHRLQVQAMMEQLDLERGRREEREAEILAHAQRQQLKLQEQMNEEQAQLCKAFALEKETLERACQEQVGKLKQEAQMLRDLLKAGLVGASANQAGPGGLTTPCACRREQPPTLLEVNGEPGQEPSNCTRSLASHGAPENLGLEEEGLGMHEAKQVASAVPGGSYSQVCPGRADGRVAMEELVLPAHSPVLLSLPNTHELPLGTEDGVGLTQPSIMEPQLKLSGPGPRQPPGQQTLLQSRKPVPMGSQAQEESTQDSGRADRGDPGLLHPQAARPEQLQSSGVQEEGAVLETEKEEMKTKLLQLEALVRAMEQDAESRGSNRFVHWLPIQAVEWGQAKLFSFPSCHCLGPVCGKFVQGPASQPRGSPATSLVPTLL